MLLVGDRRRWSGWSIRAVLETIMAPSSSRLACGDSEHHTTRRRIIANTLGSTTWSMNLVLGATLGGIVAALLAVCRIHFERSVVSRICFAAHRNALRRTARRRRGLFGCANCLTYSPIVEECGTFAATGLVATVFREAAIWSSVRAGCCSR